MSKWYDRTIGFFFWWLLYHGDENPFKLRKEIKENGYHDCPNWNEDE